MASRKSTKKAKQPYYARYKDPSKSFANVPPQDLSQTEWEALDKVTQKLALAQGVYELVPIEAEGQSNGENQ